MFFCEEFDMRGGEAPSTISGADALPLGRLPPAPISERDDCARYKGLCGNCDSRESCMYPKPEGGVWHCEEYQ